MGFKQSSAPQGCPDANVLLAFGINELDAGSMESIADHLAVCPSCRQRARQLDDDPSSILSDLRSKPSVPAFVAEPECGRMEAAAKGIVVAPQLALSAEPESVPTPPTRACAPPPPDVDHPGQPLEASDAGFTATSTPRQVGRYAIIRELGRGSFGIVYQARDPLLERDVAVKVPRLEVLNSEDLRKRFVHEAKALARLRHPHIVHVLDVGEADGYCFIVSSFCPGPTLAEWLRKQDRPVPGRDAAEFVTALADALQHAHDHGVLHRDLKPANILLEVSASKVAKKQATQQPNVDAQSRPLPFLTARITDFGLARLMDSEVKPGAANPSIPVPRADTDSSRTLTMTGELLGTIPYMAPEQLKGGCCHGNQGTDIWSLGVIFYELLSGRRPFSGREIHELLQQMEQSGPPPLRKHRPGIDSRLEGIVRKCLQSDPSRRYASAFLLSSDLKHWLASKRPLWRQRIALTAVSLLIAAVLLWLLPRLQNLPVNAIPGNSADRSAADQLSFDESRSRYRAWEQGPRQTQYTLDLESAYGRMAEGRYDEMAALLQSQQPSPGESDVRDFGWYFLHRLVARKGIPLAQNASADFHVLKCSADNRLLAVGCSDGSIRIWDTATWQEKQVLKGHKSEVRVLAFAPDGRTIASSAHSPPNSRNPFDPGELRIWDVETATVRKELAVHSGHIACLAFAPDGSALAASNGPVRTTEAADLHIWDTATWEIRAEMRIDPERVGNAAFLDYAPDGSSLAVGQLDCVSLLSLKDGHVQGRSVLNTPHVAPILAMQFAPNGRSMAISYMDGHFHVVPIPGNDVVPIPWGNPGAPVWCAAYSTTGRWLALGDASGTISLFDTTTGRLWFRFVASAKKVRVMALRAGANTLVAALEDGVVKRWDLTQIAEFLTLPGHQPREAWAVAFSPDGATLATAGDDHSVKLWRTADRQLRAELKGHTCLVSCLAFAPDGRLLASGDYDGMIRVWDMGLASKPKAEVRCVKSWSAHSGPVRALAFAANSRSLASASRDQTVKLWDPDTGHLVRTLEKRHTNEVRCVTFDPSSTTVASSGNDGLICLYDAETGRVRDCCIVPWTQKQEVWCLAFAPDGRTLAFGNNQGTISLWRPAAGKLQSFTDGHKGGVRAIAFSLSGQSIASGGSDTTIALWNVPSLRRILTLHGHAKEVNSLAFSPDGRTLASACHDGAVFLWRGD